MKNKTNEEVYEHEYCDHEECKQCCTHTSGLDEYFVCLNCGEETVPGSVQDMLDYSFGDY